MTEWQEIGTGATKKTWMYFKTTVQFFSRVRPRDIEDNSPYHYANVLFFSVVWYICVSLD